MGFILALTSEMEMGGGLLSLLLQCIHNHIQVMIRQTLYYCSHLSQQVSKETISTSPSSVTSPSFSSNVCFQSCQLSCKFIFFHILRDVVNPYPSRLPLLSPGENVHHFTKLVPVSRARSRSGPGVEAGQE